MSYYYWSGKITKNDCEKLINEFDVPCAIDASTGHAYGPDSLYEEEIEKYKENDNWDFEKNQPKDMDKLNPSIRKTKLNWLPNKHEFNKVLLDYVVKANEIVWHYNVTKFTPCQFARYDVGDFYEYHQDSGYNIIEYEKETRKLSMTVQLSDSKDYEGGEFLFYAGKNEPTIPPIQEQGSILVFDSRMWHKIIPVTRGVRYSLVSWILGPRFQ